MKLNINSHVRDVLIIVVLAAIVDGVSAGQSAATFVIQAVSLGFLAAMAWIANRLYREHRDTMYGLGTKRRTILYVAVGVAALTFSAYARLTATGIGTLAWIALIAGSAYAIYLVFRSYKQY